MGKIKTKSTVYPDKPVHNFNEWHETLLQRAETQRLKYEPRIEEEMQICEDLADAKSKEDEK